MRTALGAARFRVVRQLLTESLVSCVAGGLLGLLVAHWSLDVLLAISPADLVDVGPVHLSYPVLGFTAAVSLATAIVCGFAPAFEGSRVGVQEALKDGARQVGGGLRQRRIRQAFVVTDDGGGSDRGCARCYSWNDGSGAAAHRVSRHMVGGARTGRRSGGRVSVPSDGTGNLGGRTAHRADLWSG